MISRLKSQSTYKRKCNEKADPVSVPCVGNGGDVPPLRGTTHLEIWFVFASLLAFALLLHTLEPDPQPVSSSGLNAPRIEAAAFAALAATGGVFAMTRACSNGLCREGSESDKRVGGEHFQGCWRSGQGSRPKAQKRDDLARRTRSASILRPPYGKQAPEASGENMLCVSLANADLIMAVEWCCALC
ncbi:hypothetical protein EKO04_000328 [Ascochyta lentis]|uniref:Uncharacterized protein n=1 Tax=Ascochyta lentis TaxID=205686 RepID=A0A8H7JDI2_9PLEO|nr:hypothetical protein EKO04_000328 [Ascochyta lentis]